VQMLAGGESEPGAWSGDLYLLRGEDIVGVCKQIKFKRVPRAMMALMFRQRGGKTSAVRDDGKMNIGVKSGQENATMTDSRNPEHERPDFPAIKVDVDDAQLQSTTAKSLLDNSPSVFQTIQPATTQLFFGGEGTVEKTKDEHSAGESSRTSSCLRIIATETGLDMEDLVDEAAFAEIGVDSLMSLVLAEKFHAQLGIEVRSSIFLECATVRDLLNWLTQK